MELKRHLQHLIEANMETFFGVKFLGAATHAVGQFRAPRVSVGLPHYRV